MPYNSTGLVVHDADAHIMETPNWLRDHADAAVQDRIPTQSYAGVNELRQTSDPHQQLRDVGKTFESLVARHRSAEYIARKAAEIMARKNFAATGSFIAEDRSRALDLLGFASQLIFNTFHNSRLHDWEHSGDLEVAIGAGQRGTNSDRFPRRRHRGADRSQPLSATDCQYRPTSTVATRTSGPSTTWESLRPRPRPWRR